MIESPGALAHGMADAMYVLAHTVGSEWVCPDCRKAHIGPRTEEIIGANTSDHET